MKNYWGFNNYKANITNRVLKVDNSFEDETMLIVMDKDNEVIDNLSTSPEYFPHCLEAIKNVLINRNDKFILERVVANNPYCRYKVTYENNCIKVVYEEDGREKDNEMDIFTLPIDDETDITTIVEFVDFVLSKWETN